MTDASGAWPSVRLRSMVKILGGGTPSPDVENWDGDIPFVTPPDLRHVHGGDCRSTTRHVTEVGACRGSSMAPPGSVVVSKRAPIGYVARLPMEAAFNQGCLALVPVESRVDGRYLTWVLSVRAEEMNVLGRGTTFMEISAGDLANVAVPLPTLATQVAIGAYLDRETARIDELIGKQEQLIATLRERRAAVVSQRVDRDGALVEFRRHITRIRQGWSPNCELDSADGVEEWGVLKTGAPNGGVFHHRENKRLPSVEAGRADLAVRQGEVVMSRASSREWVGSAARVDAHYPKLMLSDLTYGLTLGEGADPNYVVWALSTRRARGLIESAAKGTSPSMQKLSQRDIKELLLPFPALVEQRQIAEELAAKTSKMDSLIGKAQQLITLAKERRAALITAAVTGQNDVREAS